MKNRIDMFATTNDTEEFVVAVDGYIQGFKTLDDANAVYAMINPAGRHFDDSGYGSCHLLAPGYRPINLLAKQLGEKEDMTKCFVSDVQQIDMRGYLTKHNKRFDQRFSLENILERQQKPAHQRLAEKREHDAVWSEIFG